MIEKLIQSISELVHEMREERKHGGGLRCQADLATKRDIEQLEKRIMSKLTDFLVAQKAFNESQSADIDALVASFTGIAGDVKSLNDKITELQNSVGGVTPEDQVLIDELQTQGAALVAKTKGAATAASDLDAQTPPVVPTP